MGSKPGDSDLGEVRSGFTNAVIARQPHEPELMAANQHDLGKGQI